ncbi:DUF4132 domain-containing protein [Glycomyces sp. L485]|uniref:DUF4132 domain-containing protein n=1 Tax=Glycomyces sp. L485 TaxID=2909235 RepID=UPI001F4B8F14|nr:DUF4132 domain-containing protein [Glycomyces sp. L485]MCH7230115.1 DUF4132 domain-containing protein [Glycomyces sp. L485]
MKPSLSLPDEDQFAVPESWRRHLRARRGDGSRRRVALKPDQMRADLRDREGQVRRTLDLEQNESFAAPALAFLDGEPDPYGAAVVAAVINRDYGNGTSPRPLFDWLAEDYGLPFAASAVIELAAVDSRYFRGGFNYLFYISIDDIGWRWSRRDAEFGTIRTVVATAPDAEYEAVLEALAARRGTAVKRLISCLIVPDRKTWIDELCVELSDRRGDTHIANALLRLITTSEQLHAAGESVLAGTVIGRTDALDLTARLGIDALPMLRGMISQSRGADCWKPIYQALAALPSDEAMAAIIDDLDAPVAVGPAIEAAARFPCRALRTIAPKVAAATREQRRLLTTVLRSDPNLVESALPALDQGTRDALEPLTGDARPVPEAAPEEIPELLLAPPWERPRPKAKPAVLEGLDPLPVNRIVWAEGERDQWEPKYPRRERDIDQWRAEAARWDERDYTERLDFLAFAPDELAKPMAARWDGRAWYPSAHELKQVLARFGLDVAPQITELVQPNAALREVLLPLSNPEAARMAADSLVRLKALRPTALAWLDRHAADAAILLIPDALGRARKARRAAEATLDYLRHRRGPELLLEAAARYGEAAVEAIRPLAERDPLEPFGGKAPGVGAWAAPAVLPQVLLKGRERALPDRSVGHLVTVLAIAAPHYRYAGIDVVAEHCDPESLARFCWALFEQWLAVGAPVEDSWALAQLAHFGDDDTVRALVPLICEWPGRKLHKRAVAGLEVLGVIGTETALRAIHRISEKVRYENLKWTAREQIEAIAAGLGLSSEQLADRLVPDFGIGEESALVYDYGPRRFEVRFDEELKPIITDSDGKARKALPKPGVRDDAGIAESSRKRFTRLKKEVRTVASDLVERLELAMVRQRTWTKAEFDRHLVDHALVRHLTHRLVWVADHGGETTAFRMAEDRSRTDVDENELRLPDDATIRLAHPVHLGDQVETWAGIFADYELLQPFEQLARPVEAFTPEELETGRLTRFEGAAVSVGSLLGLTGKGWERGCVGDGGMEFEMTRDLGDAGHLEIGLTPGITVRDVHEFPEQKVDSVRLHRHGGRTPIDPVAASEALVPLASATGVG